LIEILQNIINGLFSAHSSKFAEIFSTGSPSIINLPEFTAGIMEKVLSFLYSGKLEVTGADIPGLLNVAGKLKISLLKNYLLQNVKKEVSVQNFLAFYIAAKEENCEEAKMEALKFFAG
jgi:hypothetical protein